MKIEKLFFPLFVAAAVISIYLLFRGQQSQQPFTQVILPNSASSGVPAPYSAGKVVLPNQYPIGSLSAQQPSPQQASADPLNPGVPHVPHYLTFNMGPGNDLNKPMHPAHHRKHGCSCKSSCVVCKSSNSFVDGSSPVMLASSTTSQIEQNTEVLPSVYENTMAYYQADDPASVVSLTSPMASGNVESTPTNGTPWSNPPARGPVPKSTPVVQRLPAIYSNIPSA